MSRHVQEIRTRKADSGQFRLRRIQRRKERRLRGTFNLRQICIRTIWWFNFDDVITGRQWRSHDAGTWRRALDAGRNRIQRNRMRQSQHAGHLHADVLLPAVDRTSDGSQRRAVGLTQIERLWWIPSEATNQIISSTNYEFPKVKFDRWNELALISRPLF